jgi:hypothetical protein
MAILKRGGKKETNGEEKEVKKLLEKCDDIIRKFYCALNLPELERDSVRGQGKL